MCQIIHNKEHFEYYTESLKKGVKLQILSNRIGVCE